MLSQLNHFNSDFCLDCISLIKGMLTIDPTHRFGMNEILNHQWLKSEYDLQQLLINKHLTTMMMRTSPSMMTLNESSSSNKLDEFEPNKEVLVEMAKYNLNVEDVIRVSHFSYLMHKLFRRVFNAICD